MPDKKSSLVPVEPQVTLLNDWADETDQYAGLARQALDLQRQGELDPLLAAFILGRVAQAKKFAGDLGGLLIQLTSPEAPEVPPAAELKT